MDWEKGQNYLGRKMKRIQFKKSTKDELIDIILEKDKVIEKLEKELKKYKNSNTPSSANPHLKNNTADYVASNGAKRGAPRGHKGITRRQIPERKMIVDTDKCPRCYSEDVNDAKVSKKLVEEIPDPVVPEVVETEIHLKKCNNCGLKFIPNHNETPLKGKFGINLMVLVIFIRFLLRGVLRKTASFLEAGFAFKLTPASVNAIIMRVADAAEKEYEDIKIRIHESTKVYVDETSFSVLGINQWVWVFRTESDILLVIRPSRGNNVLEEILGKDYSGTVICDCWRAYNYLSNARLQRCWAHLLRRSEELVETLAGYNFHMKLCEMFEEIKRFNLSNPAEMQRKEKYKEMTRQLKKVVSYYAQYEQLNKTANYIWLNIENWFTCIELEGIEPTNNFAEQAIRETVMVRKIIGAFRSENGKNNYEKLASLIATWQLKGLDIKTQLKETLVKNLCFC